MMFEYCPLKDKICAMCASYKDVLYCGQANEIQNLKKCPIKVKKRGLDVLVKKRMGQNL